MIDIKIEKGAFTDLALGIFAILSGISMGIIARLAHEQLAGWQAIVIALFVTTNWFLGIGSIIVSMDKMHLSQE